MFIDSEKRLKQLSDEAKKNTEDLEEAKKNSRFTQVSPKGWERVRELLKDSQGISALKLYSFPGLNAAVLSFFEAPFHADVLS